MIQLNFRTPHKSSYSMQILKSYMNVQDDVSMRSNEVKPQQVAWLKMTNASLLGFKGVSPQKLKEKDPYAYAFVLFSKEPNKVTLADFNSPEEIQKHAGDRFKELTDLNHYKIPNKKYKEASDARIKKIEEWKQHLSKENSPTSNNPALSCIIFDAITKDLKPNNRKQPQVLDEKALVDTVGELKAKIMQKGRLDFNFLNKYKQQLVKKLSGVENLGVSGETDKMTGWVKIKSRENDPENFDANVKKMQALSCKTWCTGGESLTKTYLELGDDHIYLENGKPKVSITFEEDKIDEFEDMTNKRKIPLKYLDIVKKYIKEQGFTEFSEQGKKQLQKAEEVKIKCDNLKTKIKPYLEKKDYAGVFNSLGIEAKTLDDGMVEISEYKQLGKNFNFADLDIKENDLFKHVRKIVGDANFENTQVSDLGQLQEIGGDADFKYSQVINLGQLKKIEGSVWFNNSQIRKLGQLQKIYGSAWFNNSQVRELGQLQEIGGWADFRNSQIRDLGQLRKIKKDVYIDNDCVLDFSSIKLGGKIKRA